MKKIKLLTLLLSFFTLVVLTESCDKAEELLDPCASVTCQNDGVCVDGTCDCPDGFSGTSCEIQDLCFGITCENNGSCIEGICDCPDGYIGEFCESFDPTQVQSLLNDGQSPKALFDGGISLDNLYGKMYEGGLIFYLNTDTGTGMVAATVNQSENTEWGCFGTEINGADGTALGTGAQNTIDILNGCTTIGIAARLCDELMLNDKVDWFLPSRDELNLMYTNLHANGHGGFAVAFYWSSTELHSANSAWGQDFSDGFQDSDFKGGSRHVRAARAF